MIEVKNGNTRMVGDIVDIVGDYITTTKAFRTMLATYISDEDADKIVALCGRVAFSEKEEQCEPHLKEISKIVAKAAEVMNED